MTSANWKEQVAEYQSRDFPLAIGGYIVGESEIREQRVRGGLKEHPRNAGRELELPAEAHPASDARP